MSDPILRGKLRPDLARLLALETVPPVSTERWSPRRKAQVVDAVRAGLLSEEEVCRLYRMTADEFTGWQRSLSQSGRKGLRVTKLQRPRRVDHRDPASRRNISVRVQQGTHHDRAG